MPNSDEHPYPFFGYLCRMTRKKLFLLDAMALIYRAYYALNKNPRISSTGLNTSAILGFANTLFDVLRSESPTHIGVAFDTMAPTIRKEGYEQYKAHREETPEDIITSIPYIKELISGFNIPVLAVDGYEADDVIGTLAKRAEKEGFDVYMMTSDKDFGQLVSDHIFIYKPAKFGGGAEILGVSEVCEKFSIRRPEQVTDILGLWGDASDNIPGIPGFGEVTAKKLIAEFDTVENLIAQAGSIANEKWKEKVITYKDQAILSKQLATIILDVPVPFEPAALAVKQPDEPSLRQLFTVLEFRTFAQRVFTWSSLLKKSPEEKIQPDQPGQSRMDLFSEEVQEERDDTELKTIHNTPHSYHLADTPEKRAGLLELLSQHKSFCFDTETTGLDPFTSELVGLSFAVRPHEAFFVPVPTDQSRAVEVLNEFKPLFENERIEKTGQNVKFDLSILKCYGIDVKGPLFDTMLAHYLIQPDLRHNMDFLAETCLGYKPVPIELLIGKKGSGQLSMRMVDMDLLKDYAAEDADVTLQLKEIFAPMLEETGSRKLFDTAECPLIPVLASMEAEGVRIDAGVLKDYSIELERDIRLVEREIFAGAGSEFNISSPKQLGEILFNKLGIVDNPKKTRTKQYSTSEDVLSKLIHKHPIIQKILEYRSLAKLKSTYVDVLPTLVSQRDGRVHTSYNQAVAATGRLSSNNPNLQNIPIRTEKGREIRKAFVAGSDEHVLLSADYSQIELRIVASISEDRGMIGDFLARQDIHQATAAKIYHCNPAEVTREMRRNAKAVNFGIIYGMSSFGLSERLNIPRKEAADIIAQYFRQYPGIKTYMEHTIAFAKAHGYVMTLMNRRRYLRDINSGNATVRGFAERNAINAPIQGTAADMIKLAMVRIFDEFTRRTLRSKMILQVHDELVFDTFIPETEEVTAILREKMAEAIPLKVPVVVDISAGKNWMEAH
jgi:DNA polymerase-1